MNLERSLLRVLLWPLHRAALRLSGGRAGVSEPTGNRMGTLVLTTTGRRSGQKRAVPVYFLRDGERLVLVASNAGSDKDPAWYLNLRAMPEVDVQTPSERMSARAREATDDERIGRWPELSRRNPGCGRYERRTRRKIPVVILEPE